MSCEECMKADKKLKVMAADHSFQIKKLNEDKAEEKALFQIGVQK